MSKVSLLKIKLKISTKSVAKVLIKPGYLAAAITGSLLASAFILWSLNISLVKYIIVDAPINIWQKFDFFIDVYKGIYTTYETIQGTGIVIFSVLFGINLALLIFVLRNRGFQAVPKKSGAGGFALAILGGGCIACGTSIIAPVLATLGATSTPLLRNLSTIFLWFGSILIIYSIYKLGAVISYVLAQEEY